MTDLLLGIDIGTSSVKGLVCDSAGRLVAQAIAPDALEEDCARAAAVVTPREAPPQCAALVIDRTRRRTLGAVSLTRMQGGFALEAARPPGHDRPWARAAPASAEASARTTPQSRDATPRTEYLEPGD